VRLLADLLGEPGPEDPLGRSSDHIAGAMAIMPGIGANLSFATGRPTDLTKLVRF
jgi:hypothetical protein